VQIENDLHIRMWYLQAMEEENFTLLPRGPMAENMLRDYARHLGVDVDWALQEYERLYASNRVEPTPAFTSERRFTMPRWVIRVSAVVLALVVSGAGIFLLDPDGITTLGDNLQQLIAAPAPSPTPEPTAPLQPTDEPTSTDISTPSATPAPTVTPSPTPSNPPPRAVPTPN
jgi:cytoskeletal protein RodZ